MSIFAYENLKDTINVMLRLDESQYITNRTIFYKVLSDNSIFGNRIGAVISNFVNDIHYAIYLHEEYFSLCSMIIDDFLNDPNLPEEVKNSDLVGYEGLISMVSLRTQSVGVMVIKLAKKFRMYFKFFEEFGEFKNRVYKYVRLGEDLMVKKLKDEEQNAISNCNDMINKILKYELSESRLLETQILDEPSFIQFWFDGIGRLIHKKLNHSLHNANIKYQNFFDTIVRGDISIIKDKIRQFLCGNIFLNDIKDDIKLLKQVICLPLVYYSAFISNVFIFFRDIIWTQEFLQKYTQEELIDNDYDSRYKMNIAKQVVNDESFIDKFKEYIVIPMNKTHLSLKNLRIYIHNKLYTGDILLYIFDAIR